MAFSSEAWLEACCAWLHKERVVRAPAMLPVSLLHALQDLRGANRGHFRTSSHHSCTFELQACYHATTGFEK